jgi:3-isopropylmalate/(R)-2-methylmalate dehydratase small subunit
MGIPCVTASSGDVKALQGAIASTPQAPLTLDLTPMTVSVGTLTIPVTMGEGSRQMFLAGTWDACGQLVAQRSQIQTTVAQLPYMGWTVSV